MPETDALSGWGPDFPKIGLVVNGMKAFFPLKDAVATWGSDYSQVDGTGEVLEANSTVRTMTVEEERAFQERADEYSASK